MTSPTGTSDRRVPVYAPWQPEVGPLLSLGMILAYARGVGVEINQTFDLRPMETGDEVLEHLSGRAGPAVLLCSDYVWSSAWNLDLARRAREIEPELFVVHGGPDVPAEAVSAEAFLREHGDAADVLVRGEGELALVEVLRAYATASFTLGRALFEDVSGLSFLDPDSGELVRTVDRERIADLDTLPSPYLSGEFDRFTSDAWPVSASIEASRGCPYGCTFCDWGSATMSRVRLFDVDRVGQEIEWLRLRDVRNVFMADANFGMFPRDVDIVRRVAEDDRGCGLPFVLTFTPAKNTTRYLIEMLDLLIDNGVEFRAGLGIQTVDGEVLRAAQRQNIATDAFVALGAEPRRRGQVLMCDMLIGLPGQDLHTFAGDLQFLFDHDALARINLVVLLPNSPMNDPTYRREWQIESDEHGFVTASRSFTSDDRDRMIELHNAMVIFEQYGLLRHVLRFVQWDAGIAAVDVVSELVRQCNDDPTRVPVLAAVLTHFERFPLAPVGWGAMLQEVSEVLHRSFGLPASSALDTVMALQRAVLPSPGRRFPDRVVLDHDYVEYFRSATIELFDSGRPGTPERPLADYGPATFIVKGDPLQLGDGVNLQSAPLGAAELGGQRAQPAPDRGTVESADTHSRPFLRVETSFELESELMRMTHQATGGPDFGRFKLNVLDDYLRRLDLRAASGRRSIPVSIRPVSVPSPASASQGSHR